MRPPSAKAFLDTDCIIHLYSGDASPKPATVRQLVDTIGTKNIVVSTQVLQEFCNICLQQYNLPAAGVLKALSELLAAFRISGNDVETVIEAVYLAEQYGCSFNDGHILAAALQSSCEVLYTEALEHGLLVEERMRVINPFIEARKEKAPALPELSSL